MSEHRRAYRRITKAIRLAQSGEADSIVAAAKEILATRMTHGETLGAPGAVRDYLRMLLHNREHEVFVVVLLDAQNRVLATEELFRGTLTQTSVYPREIVKTALHLFCTRTGQRYTSSGFDSIWQRAMRKAIETGDLRERFTEHNIRAKTATDDPLNAQQRLGHHSSAMTDRYVRVRKVEKIKPLTKNI